MTTKNAEQVPDGTVEDVKKWVGKDPHKALMAMNAEQARDQPRVTLVAELEAIAYDPDALYEFTGPHDLYYPGYSRETEDGGTEPLHAVPGMNPVMFVPAGGQDLPIPPRDGNWVVSSGKMGGKKSSGSDGGS